MNFPVTSALPAIRRALAANRSVVLTAPPGSGKTTVVPPALLNESWLGGRKILMLEPRRLAASRSAVYIARQLGEEVGGTVGYQVRLERRVSKATRLEIITEGLLTQRILGDAELRDVGLVIFDEFHERSLNCDLAYALTLEIRRALREDLRILVMSATLDADEVANHLGDAEIVRAEGRMFPVETRYLGPVSMSAAIGEVLRRGEDGGGDILCFLPGEGEIRRTMEALAQSTLHQAPGTILPLYGSLPKAEQDRVFAPSDRRRIILATSIAETSLTLSGITCVIDSGLMRVPRFRPGTGMSGLVTLPLSLDRAEQRRGRAGRVRPGLCYRLWDEKDETGRAKKMSPEILNADLASTVLTSRSWGARGRTDLPWLTEPPVGAWEQAEMLLSSLGANETALSRLPMHPRLANMLLNCGPAAAKWAAILEEGARGRETDIEKLVLSPRMKELSHRFENLISNFKLSTSNFKLHLSAGEMLSYAYPDRVAKNRGNGSFRMASGRGCTFDPDDPTGKLPYVVACELDDRVGDAKVFLAAELHESEVLSRFKHELKEEPLCTWDRQNDCVKAVTQLKVGELVVKEIPQPSGRGATVPPANESQLIAAMLTGIRQHGVANLPCWTRGALELRARLNFVHCHYPDTWPEITDDYVLAALPDYLSGITRWSALEKLNLINILHLSLSAYHLSLSDLDRLAPTKMTVPSGSRCTIHYEGAEPTVEVRLQECFGLMETPKVAGGRVPVVMTLLSPAQRPVQVTKDLANFWREGYPLVRKDMRGRYPKHYWPEDPFDAVATRRVRPRI